MKQILSVPEQFGPILQSSRKAVQLSQIALASRLGISQSRMSAMELDPTSISLGQLLAICSALGLELQVQTKAPPADSLRVSERNRSEW